MLSSCLQAHFGGIRVHPGGLRSGAAVVRPQPVNGVTRVEAVSAAEMQHKGVWCVIIFKHPARRLPVANTGLLPESFHFTEVAP